MEFKKAYEALKQGALIKCPEWRGYWKWEDNSIKMHCKDGKTLDIRETKMLDILLILFFVMIGRLLTRQV